nr:MULTISPECIES: ABC transporter permease [unclassified Leucobacter]
MVAAHQARPEGVIVFVAWRDLRFARGRFFLIGTVVALITLLVGFLSGLTGGLASQNISAVLQLPGERVVLQNPGDGAPDYATSSISNEAGEAWIAADGIETVLPLGIAQARAENTSGSATAAEGTVGVALFGMAEASEKDGTTGSVFDLTPAKTGEVGLSQGAADELGAQVGDTLTIIGSEFTVAKIGPEAWYSHTPVVAMDHGDWAMSNAKLGGTGAPTALLVSGADGSAPDWDGIAADTGTTVKTPIMSLAALSTFKSEIGSLGLMIAMLFGISALVVGAFFSVWTMQRAGDVAVLKALGASNSSLIKDALGQALVVLIAGIGIGILAVTGLGLLAGQALPFLLSPLTTVLPALIMAVLGLAGAAFALRTVTKADPLVALGSHR